MKRLTVLTTVLAAGLAAPVSGQVTFGPQASYGSDSDLGIGARVEIPFAQFTTPAEGSPMAAMRLMGSFDWYFPEDFTGVDVNYMELNANAAYPLEVEGLSPYVGAGLNVARASVDFDDEAFEDDSETRIGLNILGGLNFMLGTLNTFGEARYTLEGGEQFVLTFGVLFGGQ